MSNRIIMNTNSLQQYFPEIYKNFFANNDLVISGCFSMPWGPGGVGHRSSYVRAKSKTPLKCYIGFKKKKGHKVVFNNVSFYDLSKKLFETIPYSIVNKEDTKIIEFLEDILRKNNFENGFEISILSETTRGHSFGFSGTSSAIISVGLYLFSGKVDFKLLSNNYSDFIKSDLFNQISLIARKLDLISTYGNTVGHSAINTLHKIAIPTLMYTEKFNYTISLDDFTEINSEFASIKDKFKSSIFNDFPLDYGIIFSGVSTDTKQTESFKRADDNKLNKYKQFIEEELLGNNIDLNIHLKKFIKEDSIYDVLGDTISFLSIKTIDLFKQFFEKGYDNNLIESFIDNINQLRHTSSILEKQSFFAEDFVYFFRKNRKNSEEKIGIMPCYSGKIGGGYVIVTKPGISRDTIEKTIEEMKKYYSNVEIEYSSYLDGDCSDGVIVEQYISEGIYSKYVDKNKLLFKSNKGDHYIGHYSEIIEKEKEGLILDMINNKIYLNGEKLTSKDIPSQNTTIEILTKLIENSGNEISNKELPISSYANSRNEMLGKIILPILKLIEERTKEQLTITCKGSMSDFFIKMSDINLKIGAIKRI